MVITWIVILGLLLAALFHTAWNLILKQTGEKMIVTWWALVISALICLPVLFFMPISIGDAWPYLLASAALEAAYYAVLVQAYQRGDFSLVYPIARGFAPALLAAWAVLFLGEAPTKYGWLGIILILAGLLVVGGAGWLSSPGRRPETLSILLAALVAVCISFYSLVDAAAVKQFPPASYVVLVFALTALLLTPMVVWQYGPRRVGAELKTGWRRIAAIGLLSLAAYGLVLLAYRAAPVSYAGAVREVSIVFAALAGWRLLGEPLGRTRLLGSVLVFLGILLIALGG